LLARVGNDRQRLRKLIGLFAAEGPRLLGAVKEALAHADAPRLARATHTLKGAVGNLGAIAAAQSAKRLEEVARTGDLTTALETLAVLETNLNHFRSALTLLEQEQII
jgi:HPt (histidine-containing phosphotransfer) domain-containing protein